MDDRKKKDKRKAALNEHKGAKLEFMANKRRESRDRRTGEQVQEKKHNNSPQDVPQLPEDMLAGRNAVMEALKGSSRINRLMIANGSNEGSVREMVAIAKDKGIPVQFVERTKIESIARGIRHQGVLAQVAPVEYVELEDILQVAKDKNEPPFILLLDELEDPHNLGAILRTADAAGVHGVLIPKRRSCPLSATVAKTSAGAVEYVPVARIGNIVQTIKALKNEGLWVAAADMDGKDYHDSDLTDFWREYGIWKVDFGNRHFDNVSRCGACGLFSGSEADIGMFFRIPDWLYLHRNRYAGNAGRRKRSCGAGNIAAYGKSFTD